MEDQFTANVSCTSGRSERTFVVRPGSNRRNAGSWGEPVTILRSVSWVSRSRRSGRRALHAAEESGLDGRGRWLRGDRAGSATTRTAAGIHLVAEDHEGEGANILVLSDKQLLVDTT